MTRNKRLPAGRRWLLTVTLANLASLPLLWVCETFLPDRHWPILLLTYAPPFPFAVPSLLLFLICLAVCRPLPALLNLAALLCVLFLFLGLRMPFGPSAEGPSLRVMTFNVEKWSHGAPAVAGVIRAARPDVFCLQEAGDYPYVPGHQPLALEHALPGYHFVTQGEIVIGSRFPLLQHSAAPLPPGPASRPALEATLRTPAGPITVLAVHLIPNQVDQLGRDPAQSLPAYCRRFSAARASQDAALLSTVARIRSPLLICGDFNAPPPSQSCRRLSRRFRDAFDLAGRGFGYTIPAPTPILRVDHILISDGLSVRRAWVPDVQASDHRPLVAEVSLSR